MSAMVSQITGVSIAYSAVCWSAFKRKHQSSASLAFVRGITAQRVSTAENVSIWWRHHVNQCWPRSMTVIGIFRRIHSPLRRCKGTVSALRKKKEIPTGQMSTLQPRHSSIKVLISQSQKGDAIQSEAEEVLHNTSRALQMSFRGNLFSRMEIVPWYYGTLCVKN